MVRQNHPITLRFLRKTRTGLADPDPRTDDQLTIVKLSENSVRVVYREIQDGIQLMDVNHMNYMQLNAYICRIFWLLALDDDPFKSVQFFIPGYPTILIDVTKLQAIIPQILEMLSSTYTSWPLIGTNPNLFTRPVAVPQEATNSTQSQERRNSVSSTANPSSL